MAQREVLKELNPKSVTYKRFAEKLPFRGKMQIPVTLLCKACGEIVNKGKDSTVLKEQISDDEYRLGIKFSIKCPDCQQKIFFTIDPLNTDCKIFKIGSGEVIYLNLEENDSV